MISLASADTTQQWAPATTPQPKAGAIPPPSTLTVVPSAANKKIYVIGKTQTNAGLSMLNPPPSTLPEFHSDKPFEVLSSSWKAQVLSEGVPTMDDLRVRPKEPASIACFSGPGAGNLTLICTHRLDTDFPHRDQVDNQLPVSPDLVFDKSKAGCCTRIVMNETTGLVSRQESALLGLQMNAAGCATPWGTFLTGESAKESTTDSLGLHGRLFEVNPLTRGLEAPLPIDIGGSVSIGALYADNLTHDIYIGEACESGVLYRFRPDVWTRPQEGGRLEVLGHGKTAGLLDSTNNQTDQFFHWITLPLHMQDPHEMALRMGGMPLGGIYGISAYTGELFVSLPYGGIEKKGQILRVGNNRVSVLEEAKNDSGIKHPGVLYVNSGGEMLVCEMSREGSRLMLRSQGGVWKPILWVKEGSVGGVAISPDNRALFVNLQSSGKTLILWRKDS